MFLCTRHGWTALAVLGVMLSASISQAGWVVIKNETKTVLVIQDPVDPKNPGKKGKVVRLQPGEVYREYQATPGERTIQIFDPQCPTKPLFNGKLLWELEDMVMKLQTDGPILRLVDAILPKALSPKK